MGKEGGKCDWCGVDLDVDQGYRLFWPDKSLGTAFCRLEHIVPFLMQKDDWHIWTALRVSSDLPQTSTATGEELGEDALFLVHHRGEHRITDGFEDKETLLQWARAGGHFAR